MKLALVCSLLCVAMVMQAADGAPGYFYVQKPVNNWENPYASKGHDGVNECKEWNEKCTHWKECCSEECHMHYCTEQETPEEA